MIELRIQVPDEALEAVEHCKRWFDSQMFSSIGQVMFIAPGNDYADHQLAVRMLSLEVAVDTTNGTKRQS